MTKQNTANKKIERLKNEIEQLQNENIKPVTEYKKRQGQQQYKHVGQIHLNVNHQE